MGNINPINPFSDPEFKKAIIDKERGSSTGSDDYELLDDGSEGGDVSQDLKSIISGAPSLPKTAKNLILDASALAKNEKEAKAKEMSLALNNVFTQYNKEYGTDLQINFDSLTQTLVNVSDPKSRRVLELYLSEIYSSIKPILIMHLIQKLAIAIEYITDPARMFGQDLTTADIFLIVDHLMGYINQLEELKSDIKIDGANLELQKIAQEGSGTDLQSDQSKEAIDNFMKLLNKETIKG
jgi:hypothetical protein